MTERSPFSLVAGRYRVRSLLGRGGFGVVYLAEQIGLDRPVALKLLHATHSDAVARERFEREARLAQRLEHPNTVRLLDFGFDSDGSPFIVFELLRGSPLSLLLREQGPLSPRRACRIAMQVTKSLMEAHALGIIHRDIKPANLFITEHAGEPDFCKVLDFGIAKAPHPSGRALTSPDEVIGTPAYMAPEAVSGRTISAASDLYSLGIVLAEMLTGTRLLSGDPLGVLGFQLSSEPLFLPERVTASPLGAIVARATCKEVGQRHQSAAELLRDLEAVLATLEDEPPGPQRAPRPARVKATLSDPLANALPSASPWANPNAPVPAPPVRREEADVTRLVVLGVTIACLTVAAATLAYRYLDLGTLLGGSGGSRSRPASSTDRPARPMPSLSARPNERRR